MRLLILGAEAASHHMLHVRLIAEAALARGWDVALATTPRSLVHPGGRSVADRLGMRMPIYLMPEVGGDRPGHQPLRNLEEQREQLARFREAALEARAEFAPDLVYFVDLDSVAQAVAKTPDPFSGLQWAGMLIRLPFHHEAVGVRNPELAPDWEAPLFQGLLRRGDMHSLCTIDESLDEFARREGVDPDGKLGWVPDTCDLVELPPREEARRRLGIPPDRAVLLIHGELTPRKNVHTALEAVASSFALGNVGVLLSGRQSIEVGEDLRSRAAQTLVREGRLWQMNRFLVGAEQEDAFAAADIAWLAYRDFFGMSAVLVQAGRAALPVVACKDGLIGWLTARHELGPAIDSSNPREAAAALLRLVASPDVARSFGKSGSKMAMRHVEPGFGTCVCNRLTRGSTALGGAIGDN